MTAIKRHRINTLGNSPKKNHYKRVHEGFETHDDFYMSSDINDWMTSRSRRRKVPNKPLF
jgi:hypothetical protein